MTLSNSSFVKDSSFGATCSEGQEKRPRNFLVASHRMLLRVIFPSSRTLRTKVYVSVSFVLSTMKQYKVKDDDLTFAKAINIAVETEDAAKVAKETVHYTTPKTA